MSTDPATDLINHVIARTTAAATRRAAVRQITRMTDANAFALAESADSVTSELADRDCHRRAESFALANS